MWYAEVKAKIDIPLVGKYFHDWNNSELVHFVRSKTGRCSEFIRALEWLGDRNYKEAVRDCENRVWLKWLSDNVPLTEVYTTVKAGEIITITKGRNEKYALWGQAIFDLPEEYVGEILYQSNQ